MNILLGERARAPCERQRPLAGIVSRSGHENPLAGSARLRGEPRTGDGCLDGALRFALFFVTTMIARRTYTPCSFLPYRLRKTAPARAIVYDVSSYADEPYCWLSPMWPHGGIPIPGLPGQASDSVEGIWQGLKVIDGKTAARYFSGPGRKRGGKPRGHQFGDTLLKLEAARERIYRIAYEWMLVHCIPQDLIQSFLDAAFAGTPQYFHDVSDNGNISNPDEGWAHAAVLVQYLNRRLQQ